MFLRKRERETERTCTCKNWGGAERVGQSIQSGLGPDNTEPDWGLELMNREIMT